MLISNHSRVVHLTSVHIRYDTRIFIKMCSSLVKGGFDVSLIVADGKGNEIKNDVKIYDVGAITSSKILRMINTVDRVFKKAKEIDGDIYHLHDPELLRVGLKLKKLGKKVIFDSHEDIPRQILSKSYLNIYLKKIVSVIFSLYQTYVCKKFDYVIAATPHIRDLFIKKNIPSLDINNFPIIGELAKGASWSDKRDEICYIGGVSRIRGIKELVESMIYTSKVKLNLGGSCSEKNFEKELKSSTGWLRVKYLGFLKRDEVANILMKSKAGMVTLLPAPSYIDSLPVKMFEYMSAGLPIIASSFPLWKEIVEGHNCGICVNPNDPKEIASAITFIINHPNEAEKMGKNGRKVVVEKYNWANEEDKLFKIYKILI